MKSPLRALPTLILLLFAVPAALPAQPAPVIDDDAISRLAASHDLNLPDWGPYSTRYIGTSHIADPARGLRFDLSVMPGIYRRSVDIPNVRWESGFHVWEASPDLRYAAFRHELVWKDRLYADVSYSAIDEHSRLIRAEFVNNTELAQNVTLHLIGYLEFPTLRDARVELPEGAIWVDALHNRELTFAKPRPQDNLVYDGWLRGEIRADGFVGSRALGRNFGRDAGDRVQWDFSIPEPMPNASILFRYRLAGNSSAPYAFDGALTGEHAFPATDAISTFMLPAGDLAAGTHTLALTAAGGAPIEIDGFVIVQAGRVEQVTFPAAPRNYMPTIEEAGERGAILKYEGIDHYYGVAWEFEPYDFREFKMANLDTFMRDRIHDHVRMQFEGEGEGHYTNVFMRPIDVAAGARRLVRAFVCHGTRAEVERRVGAFNADPAATDAAYEAARRTAVRLDGNSAGDPYRFSQERMAATILSNVIYPTYTRDAFVRNFVPGRWWQMLYSWDMGFAGIGLTELSIDRSIELLNAYLTPEGYRDAAFIHHGTPLPTQLYQFFEIWNKTHSREFLEFFYPRARQYHRFLAGRLGSSTTLVPGSGMLKTWDYFYNSGGWDDYPPQVHVHANKLTGTIAPVSNTAHAIRTARMLRLAAQELGLEADVAEYDRDIEQFSRALQEYSWDEQAGYFGYVEHDAAGKPAGIVRHESGRNFNMGLDGTAPLIAGITTPEQTAQILAHLTSPKELWSPIGISAVDQSAPYYRADGYWNGAVWMPHQWFYWKTMLDLGEGDFAAQIASTALELWANEVNETYNCFEHFVVATKRGAGWHQFGALSSPVINWYAAYHRPGTLTVGFDTWIESHGFTAGNRGLTAKLRRDAANSGRSFTVLACMAEGFNYSVTLDGNPVSFRERHPGTLEITLPAETSEGTLEIVQR